MDYSLYKTVVKTSYKIHGLYMFYTKTSYALLGKSGINHAVVRKGCSSEFEIIVLTTARINYVLRVFMSIHMG